VSGSLTPRELAAAIHRRFGHALPLAERLAQLDDEYDLGSYSTMTRGQTDREVMAEARQLTRERPGHQPHRTTGDQQRTPPSDVR
jgi:hypothetical protein